MLCGHGQFDGSPIPRRPFGLARLAFRRFALFLLRAVVVLRLGGRLARLCLLLAFLFTLARPTNIPFMVIAPIRVIVLLRTRLLPGARLLGGRELFSGL